MPTQVRRQDTKKTGVSNRKAMSNMGIESRTNHTVIEFLNTLLADEYTLFTKTLNYHWNLTGPQFLSLHKMLEEQYRNLLDTMDDVAERVRILGSYPLSTVSEMVNERTLSEKSNEDINAQQMLSNLYEDHTNIQLHLRDYLTSEESPLEKDPATEDFLVGLLKEHEMVGWKLKSHLI